MGFLYTDSGVITYLENDRKAYKNLLMILFPYRKKIIKYGLTVFANNNCLLPNVFIQWCVTLAALISG